MRQFILFMFCLIGIYSSYCYAQRVPVTFNFEKPVAGETYYLYNVGYDGFLCGGNLYHTQASLSKTTCWKVHVKPYIPEGREWDGTTVLIEDSIETGYNDGCYRNVFVESDGLVYTDQVEKTLFRDNFWSLKECDKENHTYNISLSMYNLVYTPESTSDFVLGYEHNQQKQSPAVILCNPDGNVDNIEWGFIHEKEFEKKWDEHNLFVKTEDLRTLIDSVNKALPNVDTNVAKSVSITPQSRIEEVLNQIGLMRAALYSQGKKCSAISFTELILNPNFDESTSLTWRMKYNNVTGSLTWKGGLNSNCCAEAYQTIFDFSQDIEGIPNGVYRMDVQAYYRTRTSDLAWFERDTAYVATEIYANGFSRPVHNLMQNTLEDKNGQIDYLKENKILYGVNLPAYRNIDGSYVPDNMAGESLVFQNGLYDQSLYFIVNDGTASIGIRQDKKRTGCWSAWDNFRLYYLGNSVEAYRSALNSKIASSKSLVTSSSILGLDNSHFKSVLAEIEGDIDNADTSKLCLYMTKLQTEGGALRDAWKQHEFNDVKAIGGYFDENGQTARDKETAEKNKYMDLAQSTFNLAQKCSNDNRIKAISLYEKAIVFAQKDSTNWNTKQELIAESYVKIKELYKYLRDYTNYEKYNELAAVSWADIYNDYAYTFLYGKDYEKAKTYIEKAIALVPTEANYYDSKGEILLMQGKNEEALEMWKKVIELNPNFLDNYPEGTELSNGLKKLGLIE